MQKRKLFMPLAAAAVVALSGMACCTTTTAVSTCQNNAPAECPLKCNMDLNEAAIENIKPGQVYSLNTDVFTLQDLCNMQNQDGTLLGVVNGNTRAIPFWTWIFDGEKPYSFDFRFVWFDKDGKYKEASPVQNCVTMPADPLRFTAVYPNDDCGSFSLILKLNKCQKATEETTSETIAEENNQADTK